MNGYAPERRKFTPVDGVNIDLKDPDLYGYGDYHSVLAQLRSRNPVYWNPEADSTGFWAVTRYDDVLRVVQDPETFSAAIENGGMRIFNAYEVARKPCAHPLASDPPQHTQLRRALQPLFSAERMSNLEKVLTARLADLIDKVATRGECDFVDAIATPYALAALTNMLDVPDSDAGHLLKWSNVFVADDDEDYQPSIQYRERCIEDMDEYALRLRSERSNTSATDFASLLAQARIDGEPIDDETYSTSFVTFLIAGSESTRNVLSAGVLALSQAPEEKEKLIADPSLIGSAVKELVRWATPLMHVRRTAMRDVELGGKLIKKGEKIVVWYNSANRDEQKWNDAMRLNVERYVDRSATPHLGFGQGPHYCQGWRVAELQLRIVLEGLLARLPDLRVYESPIRLRSNFIGGIKKLPVIFTPERG